MIDLVAVGQKITSLREEAGYSQDVLAARLLVSRQAVSAWETGKSAPSIDNVIELSKIFGVSFETLLCLRQKPDISLANPYEGHTREYVVRSVIEGTLTVDLARLLPFSTLGERQRLLRAVKEGKIRVPLASYEQELTPEELSYLTLGGKIQ
jgi:transcriptional regulator with XRE-family HTH domain